MALTKADRKLVDAIARDAVGSFAGLFLRRLQDRRESDVELRGTSTEPLDVVAGVFAEALRDFGDPELEDGITAPRETVG